MKVFVTKYALSSGIQQVEVRPRSGGEMYVYSADRFSQQFVMGKNAFETFPEAVARAEADRKRKIASLRAQISKLEELTFDSATKSVSRAG